MVFPDGVPDGVDGVVDWLGRSAISPPRRCTSDCNSEVNCARCWAKMLKSRLNSLLRMFSAALRNTSSPRAQVSTNPLRIDMTSLLFIMSAIFFTKGQFLYHLLGSRRP